MSESDSQNKAVPTTPSRDVGARMAATLEEPARANHKTVLLFILVPAALVLMVGPGTYCGLAKSQDELAHEYRSMNHRGLMQGQCEQSQSKPVEGFMEGAIVKRDRQFSRDVVRSSINGLLIMLANVLSGIGADLPGSSIFAMGISNLVANGLSIAYNRYLMDSAREEFSALQQALEYEEVRTKPREEIAEMICHYKGRGFSEEDARNVATILSKYEDFWVSHMMSVELGVMPPRGETIAVKSGLATFVSFITFGMVPVLGVTVPLVLARLMGPSWYRPQFSTLVALGISALALLLLGFALTRVAGSQAHVTNSILLLASGCISSICAFGLGQACLAIGRRCYAVVEMGPDGDAPQDVASNGAPVERQASPAGASQADYRWQSSAWPLFSRLFLRGLFLLWVAVSFMTLVQQLLQVMRLKGMVQECLRVFAYGWLTCITTGLGAVPFFFIGVEAVNEESLAVANTVASGMMLAASAGMLYEAEEHSGTWCWQLVLGLLVGAFFIRFSQRLLGSDEEAGVEALHDAVVERRSLRKAILIFTVMFCHSAAEGIAVGVAFDRHLLNKQFGFYISVLLAVHNMPEGLAVALVLVPRGTSASLAAVIATLTSIPQPLMALVAFVFVDAFAGLLPIGLSFAAGAMVYVSLHELLSEACDQLGKLKTFCIVSSSFVGMLIFQVALQHFTSGVDERVEL